MFIVPIFQLRHNQRAKVRDKSEEAMQNCAGRGAFIIITIFNKVTGISNIFPKALIPHCRNLSSPTFRFARTFQRRHATQSMSRFWEHRLCFRVKFQHIFLETLVLILKLTWLRFHKTVTQDLSYAKNFTGLRDCLRRCLSSKLQFKSLTRKSLLLRFKDSKSLMFWSKLPIFRLPDQRTGDLVTEHQPHSARGFPSRSAEMSHGRSATMFLRK